MAEAEALSSHGVPLYEGASDDAAACVNLVALAAAVVHAAAELVPGQRLYPPKKPVERLLKWQRLKRIFSLCN